MGLNWFERDLEVPNEHKLSCASQDGEHWQAVCACGWRGPWSEREGWALIDWRLHVEGILTSGFDHPWNWAAPSPPA